MVASRPFVADGLAIKDVSCIGCCWMLCVVACTMSLLSTPPLSLTVPACSAISLGAISLVLLRMCVLGEVVVDAISNPELEGQ
eukprot:3762882-Ditylum_brightwellii.AAC.1